MIPLVSHDRRCSNRPAFRRLALQSRPSLLGVVPVGSGEPTYPALPSAYTLVELLIVVTIIGIFAGLVLTSFEPSLHEQLRGTAQIVAADLSYARSLAVANNSQYQFTFDSAGRRYYLEHSGSNSALENLPSFPYRDPSDPATRQTTNFSKLLSLGGNVQIAAVRKVSSSTQTLVTTVEFGPLGALTQPEDCWIWLVIGQNQSRIFLPIEVDAVTGLPKLHEVQTAAPPAIPLSGETETMTTG